jgi:hypothetical protein
MFTRYGSWVDGNRDHLVDAPQMAIVDLLVIFFWGTGEAGLGLLLWLVFQPNIRAAGVIFSPSNARLPGWRRSADRTRLQANSLLTGNFTGNFAIFGPFDPNPKRKPAAPQLFSSSSLRSLTGKTFRITGKESAVSGNLIKARRLSKRTAPTPQGFRN